MGHRAHQWSRSADVPVAHLVGDTFKTAARCGAGIPLHACTATHVAAGIVRCWRCEAVAVHEPTPRIELTHVNPPTQAEGEYVGQDADRATRGKSRSVRAVPGGLPTLGARNR